MSHQWLICSRFSTASALAFLSLLCGNLPAKAVDTDHQRLSKSLSFSGANLDARLIPATASKLGQEVMWSSSIGLLLSQVDAYGAAAPDSVKLEEVLPSDTSSSGAAAEPQPQPSVPQQAIEQPALTPNPAAAPTDMPDRVPAQTPKPPPLAPVDADSIAVPQAGDAEQLKRLSPNPNPLLIQTEANEVEITDTQQITLEQAIALAYRNNPDLQSALLELKRSQAGLREAKGALFPTLAVSGGLVGLNTTSSSSSFIATPDGGLDLQLQTNEELGAAISAQVDLVYRLYTSGGRAASIQAAEEQVQISELEVERRREDLRINTTNEYYDLQAALEAIRISQAFLGEAERNLADTKLRQEAGFGTEFDVLRASVQVANARQDVVNSRRATNNARKALRSRLNLEPNAAVTTVPVQLSGNWPLTLEESIVLAYENRAELKQQLAQREISEQQRRLALSEIGAQIDLFANYGFNEVLNESGNFNDGYQFGAQVSWLLFEGGAARARAAQRQLRG